jgi:hypothetical protein
VAGGREDVRQASASYHHDGVVVPPVEVLE